MPLRIGEVSRDIREMFEVLKVFEAPDGAALLVEYLPDWRKVVTYVYLWVAQRVG